MNPKLFSNFLCIVILMVTPLSFGGSKATSRSAEGIQPPPPPPPAGGTGGTETWSPAAQTQVSQDQPAVPELIVPSDWSATGEVANDWFGNCVASAGDVNGDGFADLVVGAPYYNDGAGKAYLYYGSASGLNPSAGWSATGEGSYNYFGYSVASAGDVNGDGFSDLVVGSIYAPIYGRVYVYYGSANGLSSTPSWTAYGEGVYDNFGTSVASAGDVNGDGYADLLVGAPEYWLSGLGRAYVYYGSDNGLDQAPAWNVIGELAGGWFGQPVASAGDVNSDGFADVVIGAARNANSTWPGKAYVYYGSVGGLSSTPDWTAIGENVNDWFGRSAASAGDVNGDGFADLAIGASSSGKVYAYSGSASGLNADPAWSVSVSNYSVASAGDVDGDGFADLAIASPFYGGKADVYSGSAEGLRTVPYWSTAGENSADVFGGTIASAGDVNGDGLADLAVGAKGYSGWAGKAYVYYHAGARCEASCLRVNGLQMKLDPKGVGAHVLIQDENGRPVRRAEVSVHWTLPGGVTLDQTGTTRGTGTVTFRVEGGAGTYTITISDVTLAGYTFDIAQSAILSNNITK